MQDEVLLLGPWLAPLADQLAPEINVHRYWDSPDPAALLRRLAPRLRALATDAFTGASAELMTALPRLELIANFGVGYDTIDLACAR
ncbi:MAG: 2-hydroxyacid dehydrogenase, partial [Gammaproteobacteria bacterium]|nr:2-hydroxyacid dehydrogenase [Gammaproteobacteria bacterium]